MTRTFRAATDLSERIAAEQLERDSRRGWLSWSCDDLTADPAWRCDYSLQSQCTGATVLHFPHDVVIVKDKGYLALEAKLVWEGEVPTWHVELVTF